LVSTDFPFLKPRLLTYLIERHLVCHEWEYRPVDGNRLRLRPPSLPATDSRSRSFQCCTQQLPSSRRPSHSFFQVSERQAPDVDSV
jgi:hypothetical protein